MSALRTAVGVLEEIPPFRSRSLSEETLFRGHGETETYLVGGPTSCDCRCGLPIVAASGSDADVLQAMQGHHRTPEHQLYRLRMGGV